MGLTRVIAAVTIGLVLVLPQAATLAGSAQAPAAGRSMRGVTITNRTSARPTSFRGDVRRLPQRSIGTPKRSVHPALPGPKPTKAAPASAGSIEPSAAVGGPGGLLMPATSQSFKGLDFTMWGAGIPPDTTGDVGPNHYIQAVNTSIGIFSKTGTPLAAVTYDTLFTGTGTACDDSNQGDVTVVYDPMADRWFVADFAFVGDGTVPPFYECIAVSITGDPVSGGWYFYAIRADDATHPWFPDYPKMGIWPDGLYMTANMFDSANAFREVRGWAFNRQDLESGVAVRMVIVDLNTTTYFSLQPSNVRGALPPAGRENFFISESVTLFAYHVFKFHVDYSGAGSTFTGPTNVSQTSYTVAAATVPSPGNFLDSLRERVMQWAQYSNIGGIESLWVQHTVKTGSTTAPTGIQWAQINVTGGTVVSPPVQQQIYGNLDADLVHRWMGSLAVDKDGNMALGYSASSATVNPDIRYNGRLATDPLNTLPQGEATALTGVTRATQTGTCGGTCIRWGDYSSMSIDPDGCRFWYTQEYYETNGLDWQTRIASFAFPSCTPLLPTLSIDDVTHNEGVAGTTAYTFTVSLSAANPSGVTVDYKTTDGTATTADTDYTGIPTTQLSFSSVETTKQVTVNVNGDTKFEPNETFTVDLSNASGATIADSQGAGAITNDDSQPAISIDDVTHDEGDTGTTSYGFTVSLSNASSQTVTVDYATADGSATTADSDYTAITTTPLSFTPGQTSLPVTVLANGDTNVEPNETFTVDLSNAANASISDSQGVGTITNDDSAALPTFSIADKTVDESAGTMSLTITKSGTTSLNSSVYYATSNGTAIAGSDYLTRTGSFVFTPTQTTKHVVVTILDNAVPEPSETFSVDLHTPSGATIADGHAIGTITDTDVLWAFVWHNPTVAPPATNSRTAGSTFPVKFTLGGDRGLAIFQSGWPKSQRYDCTTGALIAGTRLQTQPVGSGLTYNPGTGVYTYQWHSNGAWAGTCRQFQVRLADGSSHFARFQFVATSATSIRRRGASML